MVRRFTTVPAIFSRDIFTITRPETTGTRAPAIALRLGRGGRKGEGGEYVEAVLVAGRKKFETSGGGGKNNRG